MAYESVDVLQNYLAGSVFAHCTDSKKAAGRALGTIVEIVSYYLLREWDLSRYIAIETAIPEYGGTGITHNVEFSLHRKICEDTADLNGVVLPLSISRIRRCSKALETVLKRYRAKNNYLLESSGVLRNSCTMGVSDDSLLIAHLDSYDETKHAAEVSLVELHTSPFAIVECKRVGVEEGMKKGPQTIEKAKQGAYVAKSISSLQKVRGADGRLYGVFPSADGTFRIELHEDLLEEILESTDDAKLRGFVLSVGVASNHGNWFTADDPNKEMKVLTQSYDWLLFLRDDGISAFISNLITKPLSGYEAISKSFMASYQGSARKNEFTKVRMNHAAHKALCKYFAENLSEIEGWFNVLGPKGKTMKELREQLHALAEKSLTVDQ